MDDDSRPFVERKLEDLDQLRFYDASTSGDIATVNVSVPDVIRPPKVLDLREDGGASEVVRNLSPFGSLDYCDSRDAVMGVEFWDNGGMNAVIYQRMQQWLNHDGLNEAVTKEARLAMALPFGAQAVQSVLGLGRRGKRFVAEDIRIWGKPESFHTDMLNPELHRYESKEYVWTDVNVSTLGNCACMGLNVSSVRTFHVHGESKRLYQLTPHNVDIGSQSLSLALGLGVLARHAAEYQPERPLFAI